MLSADQLSYALTKDFLASKGFQSLLAELEVKTKKSSIRRSELVRMLAMQNLMNANKLKERPFQSVLQVLCQYLRCKYMRYGRQSKDQFVKRKLENNFIQDKKPLARQGRSKQEPRTNQIVQGLPHPPSITLMKEGRSRQKYKRINNCQDFYNKFKLGGNQSSKQEYLSQLQRAGKQQIFSNDDMKYSNSRLREFEEEKRLPAFQDFDIRDQTEQEYSNVIKYSKSKEHQLRLFQRQKPRQPALKQRQRQKQLQKQNQLLRLKELEKQKQKQRERERQRQIEKQKEEQREKQRLIEKQKEEQRQRQRQEKQKEEQRQRQRQIEKQKEEERQRQQWRLRQEKQKEEERQRQQQRQRQEKQKEEERQRLQREKQKQRELQKQQREKEQEKQRQMQIKIKQQKQLKQRQFKLEQARAQEEKIAKEKEQPKPHREQQALSKKSQDEVQEALDYQTETFQEIQQQPFAKRITQMEKEQLTVADPPQVQQPKKFNFFGKKKDTKKVEQDYHYQKAEKIFNNKQSLFVKEEKVEHLKITGLAPFIPLSDSFRLEYNPHKDQRHRIWKNIRNVKGYKELLLGSKKLPNSWKQGWYFSQFPQTPFGLIQKEGGPCGLMAGVQAYYLKHILYDKTADLSKQKQKQMALMGAIGQILWRVSKDNQIVIVKKNASSSSQTVDLELCSQLRFPAHSFQEVVECLMLVRMQYCSKDGSGVALTLYSIVLTKGLESLKGEMDNPQNRLIVEHGHCSQELVNLFLTGKARSNCFDGKKDLEDGYIINGIDIKAQFGFLTIYQHLNYIQVGKNLKEPVFPVWIISKQFHYSVVFAFDKRASTKAATLVDLVYYDGLYTPQKWIVLTVGGQYRPLKVNSSTQEVLWTKFGKCRVEWSGSQRIL